MTNRARAEMTRRDPSTATDHSSERFQRLAAFASDFRNPATSFGRWRGMTGAGSLLEPMIMPWFENSEIGKRFLEMLHGYGWILTGFDWVEWRESAEGKALDCPDAIASANEEQLARLFDSPDSKRSL
jgi:hypothetical protein